MMILKGRECIRALPLFQGPAQQVARSACLGLVDCRVFVDDAAVPAACVLSLARFGIAFVAGDVRYARPLLEALRGWHPWYMVSDPPPGWHPVLAAWSQESHAFARYAFSNDPAAFDTARLRDLCAPPPGYALKRYDAGLVRQALSASWSEDQTGAFASAEAFLSGGMGIAAVREADGALMAGCTSFCAHPDGWEVQVDTHPDHRGRGLATATCAAFILSSLAQGKTPHWDAANHRSLRLAEKLGYRLAHAYAAWMLISPSSSQDEVARKVIGSTG